MARIINVTRNGLAYPMIRCPLTNMGIVIDRGNPWNQDYEKPTFENPITAHNGMVAFCIKDGLCIYTLESKCPAAGMNIVMKDWDDPVTPAESGYYKSNRQAFYQR